MGKDRVALIGLDGSGKSANIDLMKKDTGYSDYDFLWVRWKPTLVKPLYKIIGNKAGKKSTDKPENADNNDREKLRAEYDKKKALKKKEKKLLKMWLKQLELLQELPLVLKKVDGPV